MLLFELRRISIAIQPIESGVIAFEIFIPYRLNEKYEPSVL